MLETENQGEVTRLLEDFHAGDTQAFDRAFAIVYAELRRLAQSRLRRERDGHTLPATALVHEAYLKLVGHPSREWQGRAHFFGAAACAIRQVLVEHARRRLAAKRGGGLARTTLDERCAAAGVEAEELLCLNDALDRLGALDPRLKTVVEYRYFCGLEEQEIACLLEVSPRTVERDWVKARAWLYKELYPAARRQPTT